MAGMTKLRKMNKEESLREAANLIFGVKKFCDMCPCRKDNYCKGYDQSQKDYFGNACELLWIFKKYDFRFAKEKKPSKAKERKINAALRKLRKKYMGNGQAKESLEV